MRVLVVGGAGYIGGGTTDILLKRKIPFTVYDNLLYEHQYLKNVDFILGDVRDKKKLKKLLGKYSHVIWLAAIVGDPASQLNPSLTISVNRDAVRWMSRNYNGRIIFLSTCSVYGKFDKLVEENSPVNPLSLYAQTKLDAENYLKGKNSLVFRLGTVYGISDSYSRLRMDLAVNYMTANAIINGKLSVFGGEQWRPFIHTRDIAEIVIDNLEKKTNGIYNIATANSRIINLANTIKNITNCRVIFTSQKVKDMRDYRVSFKKAIQHKVLVLKKPRTITHGVREIAQLISSGRIKYTDNDVYFNERHILNLMKNDKSI